MTLPKNVAELQGENVVLELECIDRMYLNLYVPELTSAEDFGAFFIKFCSYFPYTGKLCINGHEYLNRQLAARGIEFEALDNGLLRCPNPAALKFLKS